MLQKYLSSKKLNIKIIIKVIAMIENQGAVDNLDAILDVEGLDGAFVGNSILLKIPCGFENAK